MSSAPSETGPGGSWLKGGGGPGQEADRVVCLCWPRSFICLPFLFTAVVFTCGCTSWREYVDNGFKVGPNYRKPPAPVAKDWIDASDQRVRGQSDDLSKWWTVFNDPVLDSLVCDAYRQNLSLRAAGMRVLQAQAQVAIDVGNLLPQTQTATGNFNWNALSRNVANNFLSFSEPPGGAGGLTIPAFKRWYGQWDQGFNLSWELDFWGRFRRAVEADSASLDASVENYDDVLVTLLGQVATNYAQMRITEQRIKYAQENVQLQIETLEIVEARFKRGTVTKLDVAQATSTLEQTRATIPELRISLRQFNNQLCILLGIPPEELRAKLGPRPIPTAPVEAAVGIPADLLRRRPDVRRAERQAASQSADIGVAEAEFYPHIAINGTWEYSAEFFKDLWSSKALAGSVGPTFTWNILNYGRILNNVRLQDAKFEELVATYQNTVLSAAQDVENGLVTFLEGQQRTKFQAASVTAAEEAVQIAVAQYKAGTVDFTRVTQLEQNLVIQQDTLAQAQGEIVTGLVQVYKALGGGWQIREQGCAPAAVLGDQAPHGAAEPAPAPQAMPLSKAAPRSEKPAAFGTEDTPVGPGPQD
ncbi:MAG TPA: efflux transporter outer membrane subunit [Gemmataceae bacterium]|nr:efflux transporter outer membrane subunit [Gemmataceae bacterium]